LNFLVINLAKLLELLVDLVACWLQLLLAHRAACNSHVAVLREHPAAALGSTGKLDGISRSYQFKPRLPFSGGPN
jgi:hypothetical protein